MNDFQNNHENISSLDAEPFARIKNAGKNYAKLIIAVILSIILIVSTLVIFSMHILKKESNFQPQTMEGHKYHILVVGTHTGAQFLQQVYEGAAAVAADYDAVVEFLVPESYADNVSIQTWLEYASYVGADGIIAYLDSEQEIVDFPVNVNGNKIPLITIANDNPDSNYLSFIGPNKQELGKKLANLVISLKPENAHLLIISDANYKNETENKMLATFNEIAAGVPGLSWEILDTGTNTSTSPEEIIRQTLIDKSDINMILCLSLENTLRATQSVIDLIRTGEIDIIGFHKNEKTMEYLQKGILSAIVSFEPEVIGQKAMHEIFNYKYNKFEKKQIVNSISILTSESLEERESEK